MLFDIIRTYVCFISRELTLILCYLNFYLCYNFIVALYCFNFSMLLIHFMLFTYFYIMNIWDSLFCLKRK